MEFTCFPSPTSPQFWPNEKSHWHRTSFTDFTRPFASHHSESISEDFQPLRITKTQDPSFTKSGSNPKESLSWQLYHHFKLVMIYEYANAWIYACVCVYIYIYSIHYACICVSYIYIYTFVWFIFRHYTSLRVHLGAKQEPGNLKLILAVFQAG